jgi:hypothetical protein
MTDQKDNATGLSGQSAGVAAPIETPAGAAPEETLSNCRARLEAVIRRFHGEVGSPLAAVGLRLEMIRGDASLNPEVVVALDTVSADLAAVIDCVRESVAELRALDRDSRRLDSH